MFDNLELFMDGRCPIKLGGKTYHVPEPTVAEGLRLEMVLCNPDNELTDDQEYAEILNVLGPVWDEMSRDGVGRSKALFAGRVALIWYTHGPSAAQTYASGGEDPKNPLPRPGRLIFRRRGHMGTGIRAAVLGWRK